LGCSKPREENILLRDYIHGDTVNQKFVKAETFRNGGNFKRSDSIYKSILNLPHLSKDEVDFAKLNSLLSRLADNDTLFIEEIPETNFKAIQNLISGIVMTRKDRSGFALLHKARELLKRDSLENSFYFLIVNEQIGLSHKQKGSYMDSVKYYYNRAYHVAEALTPLATNRTRILYRLGLISLVHRDEVTGLGHIERALEMKGTKEETAKLLLCKATLLRKLNRFDESNVVRTQASDLIHRINGPHSLMFLLYQEQGVFAVNQKDSLLFEKSLVDLQKIADKVPAGNAHISYLKAMFYYELDDLVHSFENSRTALPGFLFERIPDSAIIMTCLYMLTDCSIRTGKFEEAEKYAFQSLVHSTPMNGKPYTFKNAIAPIVQEETYSFINYDLLGRIYLSNFKEKSAIGYLHKSFILYSLIDSLMLQQIRTQEDESTFEFLRVGHEIYSNAIETCYLLYKQHPNKKWIDHAHRFMERSKSLALYQDILAHDESYFPHVPKEFKNRELQIKMRLSSQKRNSLHVTAGKFQETLLELEKYHEEMKSRYPDYFLSRYQLGIPDVAHFSELVAIEKTSLLQYHISESSIYAIRYDVPLKFVAIELTPVFKAQIESLLSLLKTPSVDPNTLQQFKEYSIDIYSALVRPFEPLKENILIVPEGQLSKLPFEVLLRDTVGSFKTLPYLLKDHTVSYCFSLKLLKDKREPKSINSIVAYGFSQNIENRSGLSALPGSITEIEILKNEFPKSALQARTGKDATRSQFLEDIEGQADLIHIGLHATSDATDRLSNRIYFQSENPNKPDTVFGFEIIPKSINAHTVVLTSCQSADGAIIKGEGTFSLARAFQQTGVDNVISSLWSQPDFSSPILCEIFYKKIRAGSSPALSLCEAKRSYINSADSFTGAPFYWAGLKCFSR
jgi:CHAT domain-containing protein